MSIVTDKSTSAAVSGVPASVGDLAEGQKAGRATQQSLLQWPRVAWLYGALIALLYAPVVWETSRLWFTNDAYGHGVLILPIAAGLVWLRRKEISQARLSPLAWGLVPLIGGLGLLAGCYLLRIGYWAIWSLVPVLFGCVLIAHGKELAKIVSFAVCLLIFAGPMPDLLTHGPQDWTQSASTTGAAAIMSTLGFPLVQHGNAIELPQGTLDVADVCSGFRKLIALTAFGLVYGYCYPIALWKRAVLALAAAPIAVVANITRICCLIAVTHYGGVPALHAVHAFAEFAVLALSFVLFVVLGRKLGCREPRFSI